MSIRNVGAILVALALVSSAAAWASTTRSNSTHQEARWLEHALLIHLAKEVGIPKTDAEFRTLMTEHPEKFGKRGSSDSWGRPFHYRYPATESGGLFDLYSFGPNGIDDGGNADDVVAWEYRMQYSHGRFDVETILGIIVFIDGPILLLLIAIDVFRKRTKRS